MRGSKGWWLPALLLATVFLSGPVGAAETRGIQVRLKASESADAPVAETVDLYKASHALVIGIDKYTGGWPRLSKAVEDARTVADELRRQGFEVTLKTDLNSDQLQKSLKDFFAIKGADRESRLLLWYAGHGHTIDGEGFLVPADAPPAMKPEFKASALPMRDFGSLVRLAESKHVLSVFDSCFSGTIFNTRAGAVSPAITRKATRPVRQFITAGDAGQQVRDDGSFREYFLRAVRGDEKADFNDDGYVTGEELGMFLDQQLSALTSAAQTPKWGKLHDVKYNEGDFVFALPRAGAAAASPPSPPPTDQGGFSLDDLASQADKEAASRQVWATRQEGMLNAFREVESFELRDVKKELKVAAWDRFLSTYKDDNPYSHEDEELVQKAKTRKQQIAVVAPVSRPSHPPPERKTLSRDEATRLITDYYNTRGVWAGTFRLDSMERMEIGPSINNTMVVKVRYRYVPIPGNSKGRTDTGYDQRTFTVIFDGKRYSVRSMGDYMSAKFD